MRNRKVYISIICFGWLFCTLLFSGCGKTIDDPPEGTEKEVSTQRKEARESEETATAAVPEEEKESQTEAQMKEQIAVNTNREETVFLCEDGIDLGRAVHRCVSDGENLYLAYSEKDLYVLPLGETQHKPAGLVNPEGLMVCSVTRDMEGYLHLLMSSSEFDRWYIWQLNDALQVEKEVDITACFDTKQIPLWFMVDKNGNYYLQWMMNRNGAIVREDGTLLHRTTTDSLGISWIYEAAVGNDGLIYLLYSPDGDGKEIGTLDTQSGCLRTDATELVIPGDDAFSAMAAGTDTEILVFGPYCGAWAYDSEKGTFEQRIKLSDIGYEEGVDYRPLNFLADGRLLTEGSTTKEETLLKYIPAGR